MAKAETLESMGSRRAWTAVLLLTFINMVNIVDRSLPGVLLEPIKRDLALSDTALGLINGFGFLIIYSTMTIPIARLTDRGLFGTVIGGSLALWSGMTLFGAFVQNGWQLALTRMGVALGEAGGTPGGHAFVARNFAPEARAAPLSVIATGVPIATIIGVVAGGLVAASFGWRTTFAAMGVLGLVIAPVALLLLGPRQAMPASDEGRRQSISAGFSLLKKRSYLMIVIACSFIGISGYATTAFAIAFLMRGHAMPLAEVSVSFGLTAGIVGILGVLLAGYLADRLARRDPRWTIWLIVAMIALLSPCMLAAYLVPGATASFVLLSLGNVIGSAYMPPTVAAIQRLAPPDLRASASAIMLLFTALAGGLGPLLVGMISDALEPQHGQFALGWAMLIIPAAQVLAGLFYVLAARTYLDEVEDA